MDDDRIGMESVTLDGFLERISITDWKDHKGNDISADIRAGAMMEADLVSDSRVIGLLSKMVGDRVGLSKSTANTDQVALHAEVARIALRAMWRIVREAAAPGAEPSRRTIFEEALRGVLTAGETSPVVRREVLWMLSEMGDAASVPAMAAALSDPEVREDARGALERIPGDAAVVKALREAFESAPEDFRHALAESLRARGAEVEGYPSVKMKPACETAVKAL